MSGERIEVGVSRVAELENILSDILDLWNRDILTYTDIDDLDEVGEAEEIFEAAAIILGRDEPELEECD